jgi:hypothetical protein
MSEAVEKSLETRCGGDDAIATATDDVLGRLPSAPPIGVYWQGHSQDPGSRRWSVARWPVASRWA